VKETREIEVILRLPVSLVLTVTCPDEDGNPCEIIRVRVGNLSFSPRDVEEAAEADEMLGEIDALALEAFGVVP